MSKYYEVIGIYEGASEVLFGSYDRIDCKYEIEAEKTSWKDQGYKGIKIVSRLTEEKPDPTVYDNIADLQQITDIVKNEDQGDLDDYIADGLIVKNGDQYVINDSDLIEQLKHVKNGLINKHMLWIWQAPAFNFELDKDQLLTLAIKKGFVVKTDHAGYYLINEGY